MEFSNIKIGFALTGSFCTINNMFPVITDLITNGADIIPILSQSVYSIDTKFGNSKDLVSKLEYLTNKKVIRTLTDVEPIGPTSMVDIIIVAPCTGNTIAKIATGITDTPVTMACKSQLRNEKPVVLFISTNDGLSSNAKNIGLLMNAKNIYFVPFKQDDPVNKPNSLLSEIPMIIPTIARALKNKQLQPILV